MGRELQADDGFCQVIIGGENVVDKRNNIVTIGIATLRIGRRWSVQGRIRTDKTVRPGGCKPPAFTNFAT